jgi:hypothetical protein
MIENQLRDQFVQAAAFAVPHARLFVRQIINVETKAGWRARAGIRGQADIYAIVKGGKHIEIECKAAKYKWYKEQLAWRSWCEANGIPYLVLQVEPKEAPADTLTRWLDLLRAVA